MKPFGNSSLCRVNITCLLPPAVTVPARYPGSAKETQLSCCPGRAKLPSREAATTLAPLKVSGDNKVSSTKEVLSTPTRGRQRGALGARTAGPTRGRGQLESRCRFRRGWGLRGSRDLGRLQNFPPPPLATAGFCRNLMT